MLPQKNIFQLVLFKSVKFKFCQLFPLVLVLEGYLLQARFLDISFYRNLYQEAINLCVYLFGLVQSSIRHLPLCQVRFHITNILSFQQEFQIRMAGDRFLTSECFIPSTNTFFFYNFCINPLPTPVSRSNCRWEAPLSLSCLRTFRFTSSGSCWKAVLVAAPVASFI